MEDILDLYEEPYDPKGPTLCMDEMPCQLIGDILTPIPVNSGRQVLFLRPKIPHPFQPVLT